jgi:hypothetical protein
MTITPNSNPTAFVFRRRRALAPPALRLHVSSGPIGLAAASTASSSPPNPSERPTAEPANLSAIASLPLPNAQAGAQIETAAALSP